MVRRTNDGAPQEWPRLSSLFLGVLAWLNEELLVTGAVAYPTGSGAEKPHRIVHACDQAYVMRGKRHLCSDAVILRANLCRCTDDRSRSPLDPPQLAPARGRCRRGRRADRRDAVALGVLRYRGVLRG